MLRRRVGASGPHRYLTIVRTLGTNATYLATLLVQEGFCFLEFVAQPLVLCLQLFGFGESVGEQEATTASRVVVAA